MHKRSLALLHSKMSTLHTILDRLPKPMDDTPNTEQMFADENHDFIKLFNGNANFNDETEIHNDLPYPTDDTYCMYYTPDEVAQTIGNENNQLSIFSLNCRSINANWDSLNQLIYNMTTDHCRFDFIGLQKYSSSMMTLTIPYRDTILLNLTLEITQMMATVELVFMLTQTCRIAGETTYQSSFIT